jgi:hypothetical protein
MSPTVADNRTRNLLSPDGHWVAYTSNESGGDEVYVVPFAAPQSSGQTANAFSNGKWKISNSGGHAPKWNQNKKELFLFSAGQHAYGDYPFDSGLDLRLCHGTRTLPGEPEFLQPRL